MCLQNYTLYSIIRTVTASNHWPNHVLNARKRKQTGGRHAEQSRRYNSKHCLLLGSRCKQVTYQWKRVSDPKWIWVKLSGIIQWKLSEAYRWRCRCLSSCSSEYLSVAISTGYYWNSHGSVHGSAIVFVSSVVLQTFTHSVHSSGNNVSSIIKVKNCQFMKSCLFRYRLFFSVFFLTVPIVKAKQF